MDKLALWKQLDDFRSDRRNSLLMRPIAGELTSQDSADLAAYYSMLPTFLDPEDKRAFPQGSPAEADVAVAVRLVTLGDGLRGIPPCQACHGGVGYVRGAPSLAIQNGAYILNQLEGFAGGLRTNDIDMPMRSIAKRLTDHERQTLADYYGSGLGMLPASATEPK
jgi:cytochrome c553